MGWLIGIIMLVIGCFEGNDILVLTSGLYAIAGAVGSGFVNITNKNDSN